MKKTFIASLAALFIAAGVSAQTDVKAKAARKEKANVAVSEKKLVKQESPAIKQQVAPASAAPMKKDGTPDKRYKENKEVKQAGVPLKKDGTPDMRYKENKANTTAKPVGPLKKDGTPDMRHKENKAAAK